MLDPSIEIREGFGAYVCKLKDGQVLLGLLDKQDAGGIVLKDIAVAKASGEAVGHRQPGSLADLADAGGVADGTGRRRSEGLLRLFDEAVRIRSAIARWPLFIRTVPDACALAPANVALPASMNMQYTIRAVPPAIDRALRRRAKQEAKSLNAVAVEALARGLELDAKLVEHTDLDALVGSWQEDKAFDRAVADFERVDEEEWK